jgi:hypothetical protein
MCNFDSQNGQEVEVVIPSLAMDMMQIAHVNLKLKHAYIPPTTVAVKATIKGNKVYIPANSALMIKL